MTVDEGTLDPWVADWFEANPERREPIGELSPELLELARSPHGFPVEREIARVADGEVDGVPVRFYEHDEPATGVVVYFHGGGYCIGSIGLMDNVARELAHRSGAAVISVGYRLAPEHPFPAGLDDCEAVTRWALANTDRFGVLPHQVAVAGESAGGNFSATVSLRLRGTTDVPLAGQALLYPGTAPPTTEFPSQKEFDGLVIGDADRFLFWEAYSGGRDISRDPFAAPLHADDLSGLPPALVVLGGCDVLRDEGRAYARRLVEAGVPTEEVCFPGQPHGFLNFMFPAAADAFELTGRWLRDRFDSSAA